MCRRRRQSRRRWLRLGPGHATSSPPRGRSPPLEHEAVAVSVEGPRRFVLTAHRRHHVESIVDAEEMGFDVIDAAGNQGPTLAG